jgi:O-antigen/teichoic acid export membrane protein
LLKLNTPPAAVRGLRGRLIAERAFIGSYLQVFGGQVTLSIFNFALNLLMIRALPAAGYGIFAFAIVLGWLATFVNGALVTMPFLIHVAATKEPSAKNALEKRLFGLNLIIAEVTFILALLCGGIETRADGPERLLLICLLAAYVVAFMQRQHSRGVAYARQRVSVASAGDLGVALLGSAMLLAVWFTAGALPLELILATLTASNFSIYFMELGALKAPYVVAPRWEHIRHYRELWVETRWSLLGSVTTFAQSQAHSLIVTLGAGPQAFAPLAAAQVLIAPFGIAANALQNTIISKLAIAGLTENDTSNKRIVAFATAMLCCFVLAIAAAVYGLWEWIWTFLYAQKYSAYPMGWLVAGFFGVALVRALYTAPSCLFMAVRQFKVLALMSVLGGLISLASVALIVALAPFPWAILGILLGELCFLIYLTKLTLKRFVMHDAPADLELGSS